jgi:hypothetical protein
MGVDGFLIAINGGKWGGRNRCFDVPLTQRNERIAGARGRRAVGALLGGASGSRRIGLARAAWQFSAQRAWGGWGRCLGGAASWRDRVLVPGGWSTGRGAGPGGCAWEQGKAGRERRGGARARERRWGMGKGGGGGLGREPG